MPATATARDSIITHLRCGRLAAAHAAGERALQSDPQDPNLHQLLGIVALQENQLAAAVARFQSALRLNPGWALVHSNLAFALLRQGRVTDAAAAARRAIAIDPTLPEPHTHLANALHAVGQPAAAIASHQDALACRPDSPALLGNLAAALHAAGHAGEAVPLYRRAVALEPTSAALWTNFGVALQATDQTAAAQGAHRRAITLDPAHAPAHANLGVSLLADAAVDDAVTSHRRATALSPDAPTFHVNLALALLTRGDYAAGWREYESRWSCSNYPDARRRFTCPRWNGSSLAGQTVLLHAEQGLGDTLQFARYLPHVLARAGGVILEVQPALVQLLHEQPWTQGIDVRSSDPLQHSTTAADVHLPLMSIPALLGWSVPTPAPVRLHADPARTAVWRDRLGDSRARRIGVVWAGNPAHGNDRHRSLPLHRLATLHVPDATIISLQCGLTPSLPAHWIDAAPHLHDFADTAAVISQLDAVLTVDTAVAHLAAAMGKPAGLLLPRVPDFRWGLHGDTTPWYPTMRLFRQPAPGDWSSPLAAAVAWLCSLPSSPEHGVHSNASS